MRESSCSTVDTSSAAMRVTIAGRSMGRFPAILSILAGLITWNYMCCVPNHGSGDLQEGESHMVPDSFSGLAQTQAPHPLADVSRWAKRAAKLLGAAAVVSLLASTIAFANDVGNSQQAARVEHACSVVMGLHRPGDLYDTCIRSLNNT